MAKTTPPDPTTPAAAPVRVRAKSDGFYNGNRIRTGKTFTLKAGDAIEPRWMELVDASVADDQERQRQAAAAPREDRPRVVPGRTHDTQPQPPKKDGDVL